MSVGVTYGYGSLEELKTAGATHTVNTVEELKALIFKL
jgi:phosphoglycolate phosphatase-like HAD superfamily hydrolase